MLVLLLVIISGYLLLHVLYRYACVEGGGTWSWRKLACTPQNQDAIPIRNNTMTIQLQPTLQNDRAILYPLQEADYEDLLAVAADPLIWEQHPNKDRWRREVFRTFFDGALQSKGAFKIIDKATGKLAGSTRIYDYNAHDKSILIGYTFFGREFWGKGLNLSVKTLLLNYLFGFADQAYFHIGAVNLRSQIAIERLGAVKTDELEVAYFGESPKLNYVYRIRKQDWRSQV